MLSSAAGSSPMPQTWRAFLGDAAPPPPEEQLKEAAAALAESRAACVAQGEHLALTVEMLRAAEQELRSRSEQLELTTEMLRTTDRELREELRRKDEQLELTVEMLRKSEHEIAARNSELAEARRELARLRGEGGAEAAPLTLAALMAAPPDDDDDDGLDGHLAVLAAAQEALDGTVAVAPPSPDAAAAAAYPYGPEPILQKVAADVRAPDRLGPEITPHQVELAREDPLASMRPKEVVRDARSLIDYLQAKEANPRLPFSRSSVVTGTW